MNHNSNTPESYSTLTWYRFEAISNFPIYHGNVLSLLDHLHGKILKDNKKKQLKYENHIKTKETI